VENVIFMPLLSTTILAHGKIYLAKAKFCRNIKNSRVRLEWELNHLNFCANNRARMRVKPRVLPIEESLKNDEEKEEKKKREKRVLSSSRIARKFRGWSRSKLFSNYRQTIVATDLVFGLRQVYDVPKILRNFSP